VRWRGTDRDRERGIRGGRDQHTGTNTGGKRWTGDRRCVRRRNLASLRDTLSMSFETPQGIVTVVIAGGVGELDHSFSNATAVENLAGTAFTGAAHRYRIVLRVSGTLRSPVVFASGRETLEPIDSSGAHATISINGSAPRVYPPASYESLTYTCSGNTLTETDSVGDVYTFRRVSSVP
jgi:hypothetical protein